MEVMAVVAALLALNLVDGNLGVVPASGCPGHAALMNTRWRGGDSQQSRLYASISIMGGGNGSIV